MICVLKGDFMDTSYYHNFITLVQTGNMTQAAEILHITQPALSKQLKYLEAEFGAQLINIKRGQRGSNLQLTDAGKIFYEKAQQLCSIEESTYNAVQQLTHVSKVRCASLPPPPVPPPSYNNICQHSP